MWTEVNFGKWNGKGKTLPQIVVSDPDWFFWAYGNDKFRGRLDAEAEDLARRARAIKLPPKYRADHAVSYNIGPDGSVWDFDLVPKNQPLHVGSTTEKRSAVLDLAVARLFKSYDKLGNKKVIKSFRSYWFDGKPFTKARIESFFSDPSNFVNP